MQRWLFDHSDARFYVRLTWPPQPLLSRAMSILSDRWIREQAQTHGMIEPFVEAQRREGCISYGLSSYGYDARVSNHFKIFTNVDSATVFSSFSGLPPRMLLSKSMCSCT